MMIWSSTFLNLHFTYKLSLFLTPSHSLSLAISPSFPHTHSILMLIVWTLIMPRYCALVCAKERKLTGWAATTAATVIYWDMQCEDDENIMHKLSDPLPKLIMLENTSHSPPIFSLKVPFKSQRRGPCFLLVLSVRSRMHPWWGFFIFFFGRCVSAGFEHVFFSLLNMSNGHSYIICHAWHIVIWS